MPKAAKKPLVSVCCIAYNQEKYIEETIKGFLMQETDFPFEVVIYDDHSTDSTPAIIRRYAKERPDVIVPMLSKTNVFSKRTNPFSLVFPKARGKYIATCEGDDYWSAADKLQRQVDFLESHPDHVSCFHYATWFIQETGKIYTKKYGPVELKDSYTIDDILSNYCFIHTAAHMFRKKFATLPPFFNEFFPLFDYPLFVHLATHGPIGFLPVEGLSVYRYNPGGVWAGVNALEKTRHGVKTPAQVARLFGLMDRPAFQRGSLRRKRDFRRELLLSLAGNDKSRARRLSLVDLAVGDKLTALLKTYKRVIVADSGNRAKELMAVAAMRKELNEEFYNAMSPQAPWLYDVPAKTTLEILEPDRVTTKLKSKSTAVLALDQRTYDTLSCRLGNAVDTIPLLNEFDELDGPPSDKDASFIKIVELHATLAYEAACARFGGYRLPLFGAGKFAIWLLATLKKRGKQLPSAIYDDAPHAVALNGVPIIPTAGYGKQQPTPYSPPGVILGTDCKQDVFKKRCEELFPSSKIVDLYGGESTAALPKIGV